MIGRAVIGASFGDEGKGLITDYLCRTEGAGVVVRYSGGANAGHTVVAPDGRRHVFHHFGSGTLAGVPTFLSQFFTLNPILFFEELMELQELGVRPLVYAHPACLVTTFADMMINQAIEDARGKMRHGSTGVGVNETFVRSAIPRLNITMADLWNGVSLNAKLEEICGKYSLFRSGKRIEKPEAAIEMFGKCVKAFASLVHPLGIAQCVDPIFEGSQGLLLDQDNEEYFPHVTRTNTGIKNVRILCAQAGISQIVPYYVSRTYLTRHGAGKLPGEDSALSYFDDTNVEHDYQGRLRFAALDAQLHNRIVLDSSGTGKLVLTHCDQRDPTSAADLYSFGPKSGDVQRSKRVAA